MPKLSTSSPAFPRPEAEAPDCDLPCTRDCFGVPPRSLSATVWQVLPQLVVAGAFVLASCVEGAAP